MSLYVEEIVSIGAVDAGDNPEADITFWKRHPRSRDTADTKEQDMAELDLSGLPEETVDAINKHVAALETERDEALAALPEEDPAEKAVADASDEVKELIAKQRADLAAQSDALDTEIAKRRDTEFIAKTRADKLEVLLGKAEDVGPLLRRLDDADPEAFKAVYQAIATAAQRDDLAKMFTELGSNDGEKADYEGQRDAWVAKQRKDGSDDTVIELRKQFVERHPDLVAASREAV